MGQIEEVGKLQNALNRVREARIATVEEMHERGIEIRQRFNRRMYHYRERLARRIAPWLED